MPPRSPHEITTITSITTRVPQRAVRRSFTTLVVGVVALVMVALCAVIGVIGANVGTAAADGCTSPLDPGSIRVVIVVDPGAAGGASSVCLVVPDGTTGSQLLARRATALGATGPRYAGSGLLCAIDGYPGSGCGDRTAGGYAYWAYFAGRSGSWIYGNLNPFIKRLHDGDVEGWRFVDGAGDGGDPPPSIGPGGLFPALDPVVATTAPSNPPSPSGAAGTASMAAAGDDRAAPSDGRATTEPTVAVGASDPSSTTTASVVTTGDVELAAATGDGSSHSSGSSLVPWIVTAFVVVLVMALGVGAVRRSRSSS